MRSNVISYLKVFWGFKMDFELSNEQQLLKDSVSRLIADNYDLQKRGAIIKSADGYSKTVWKQLTDLGLLGLSFSSKYGGFDGGPVEQMIVLEAFGTGLLIEPYLATIVLSGTAIQSAADENKKSELLSAISNGDLLMAFAHGERLSRYQLSQVETKAQLENGTWILNGEKTTVLHGGIADTIIVTARTKGSDRSTDGISLFLVPAKTKGITINNYPTIDGMQAADIKLSNVSVPQNALLGECDKGFLIIEKIEQHGIAAVAAESVGAMQCVLDMTVDYLKTRTQFGRPIGDFQVLQHRAADMYVAVEEARSIAIYAAMMTTEKDTEKRRHAMATTKAQIGVSCREVGQGGVQLHGGIGITEEYAIGHYFKRLSMIERQFGDVEHHMTTLSMMDSPD